MYSEPLSHRKPILRPNFDIIPPPFDIKKNMPNLTAPSEFPEIPYIKSKSYKQNQKLAKNVA